MFEVAGINFNDTIMVLYSIKEKKGHKTLNETYSFLNDENKIIDSMLDVLLISYNLAHVGNELDDKGLANLFAQKGVGFGKMATIYRDVVEKVMFSGMSDKEIEDLKNQLMNQKK